MGSDKGLHRVDDFAPITLERVGQIIEPNSKQQPDERIGRAIQNQLVNGIVDDSRSLDKAGSERAVIAFLDFAEIENEIVWTIGTISHHYSDDIAAGVRDSRSDGETVTIGTGIRNDFHHMRATCSRACRLRSSIGAAIINHYHLKVDSGAG